MRKQAGLGLNTISNYESGKTYPRDRKIYSTLAQILEVSPDYLHNENDDFLVDSLQHYGPKGAKQAQQILADVQGLFAGGEMADEDMDEMMRAIQDAYWIAKENNKKYAPKRYRRSENN